LVGLSDPIEVTTIGDVPGGTGMGSSSTLTVGLLNAFYAYQGRLASPTRLGEEACRIEIDALGKPIGRQDQYAAAFGGLNYIRFRPDDTVDVQPVPCHADMIEALERHALLLYTNQQRDANAILGKQSAGTRDKAAVLREMRDQAAQLRDTIAGGGGVEAFARILHRGWELKRSLGFGISDSSIDGWYEAARRAGAFGGKLLGAGGGGFMLLLAPPERHNGIREALGRPQELPFEVDRAGSRIIFITE
jgi:D-glycero-alpha-D-manno-heptose-7-phosphate kinase